MNLVHAGKNIVHYKMIAKRMANVILELQSNRLFCKLGKENKNAN